MQIQIQIMVMIEGSRSMFFANPYVKTFKYKENPDVEAAKWAYVRYRQNRQETGYRDCKILSIVYNGDHDITELVKEFDNTFDLLQWRREGYIK